MKEFLPSAQDIQLEHQELSFARAVLSGYPFDLTAAAIDCPASARGFSGAAIYRVQTSERIYCLRRWPREGLPTARLRELHHFLGHLQHSGVDVIPLPLTNHVGETLVTHFGSWWQLEHWMPGTADFHRSPTDTRLRNVMHTLAGIHRAAERYRVRTAGLPWFAVSAAGPSPAVEERLAIIAQWTPERITKACDRLRCESHKEFRDRALAIFGLYQSTHCTVQTELRSLQGVLFALHPCLRDVWHDHVLFEGEVVTGLVDPAAMRTESVAADLSRLLGSLVEDDYQRWEYALQVYSTIRPLTDDDRRLIRCLDRSGVLLSGLTWIDRRLGGRLSDADVPRVLLRLQTISKRLQFLAGQLP